MFGLCKTNSTCLIAKNHQSMITDLSNEVKFYLENLRPDARYRNHFFMAAIVRAKQGEKKAASTHHEAA
jgi:hypothetical protein